MWLLSLRADAAALPSALPSSLPCPGTAPPAALRSGPDPQRPRVCHRVCQSAAALCAVVCSGKRHLYAVCTLNPLPVLCWCCAHHLCLRHMAPRGMIFIRLQAAAFPGAGRCQRRAATYRGICHSSCPSSSCNGCGGRPRRGLLVGRPAICRGPTTANRPAGGEGSGGGRPAAPWHGRLRMCVAVAPAPACPFTTCG